MERRRRVVIRGDRNQKPSVRALGQMFEELIRISANGPYCSSCVNEVGSSELPHIETEGDDTANTGHCPKTAILIDGNPVKNKKQFFEEQVHVFEGTTSGKPRAEINTGVPIASRFSSHNLADKPKTKDTEYLRRDKPYFSYSAKKPEENIVKNKRQLFEGYVNKAENKSSSFKSGDGALQSSKRVQGAQFFNGYTTKRPVAINNTSNENKENKPIPFINNLNHPGNETLFPGIPRESYESSEDRNLKRTHTAYEEALSDMDNSIPTKDFANSIEISENSPIQYRETDYNSTKDSNDARKRNKRNRGSLYEAFKRLSREYLNATDDEDQADKVTNEGDSVPDDKVYAIENTEGKKDNQYQVYENLDISQKPMRKDVVTDLDDDTWVGENFIQYKAQEVSGESNYITNNVPAEDEPYLLDLTDILVRSQNNERCEKPVYETLVDFNDMGNNESVDGGSNLLDPSTNIQVELKKQKEYEQPTYEKPTYETLLDFSDMGNNETVARGSNLLDPSTNIQVELENKREYEQPMHEKPAYETLVDFSDMENNEFVGVESNLLDPSTNIPVELENKKGYEQPRYENLIIDEDEYPSYEETFHIILQPTPYQKQIDGGTPSENVDNDIRNDSDHHIEKCISNVTEAFESIQTLCNKPRWQTWDTSEESTSADGEIDYDNMFGTLLNADDEFCVETFNSGNENVLFKISIGREVIPPENEYDPILTNGSVSYDDIPGTVEYEDPEYCHIEDIEIEVGGGTFFDKDENPRIEIIGTDLSNVSYLPQMNIPKPQHMIINELIETEETYIRKMKYIIDNYLMYFRDFDVSPKMEMIFGNIEEIYDESRKMCSRLRECSSVNEIARVFLTSVHLFDFYIKYIRNKRNSHALITKSFANLIKNRQLELEDQYTCESYLLNPIQRPGQHKLLLERLQKTLAKNAEVCESLDEAIILVDKKISQADTALTIDSIQSCPVDLEDMGLFLMRDTFNIKRKYKSMVFLFQGGVVFCVEDQTNSELYDYIEYIKMDKLTLRHCSTSSSFQLSYFDKSKKYGDQSQYEYDLEAPSMAVKEKWIDEIQRILWSQLQYYKDQQRNAALNRQSAATYPHEDVAYSDDDNSAYYSAYDPVEYEEPEYCAIEDSTYDDEREKMHGTFYDKDENPRIEIIRSDSQISDTIYMENVPKPQYMIIKELINTEETYLRKMAHIIADYYAYFKAKGVSSDIDTVFGNIEDVYDATKKMYFKLLECDSVDKLAKVFLDNAYIFDLYVHYMRNKSLSYHYANTKFKDVIRDRQIELEDQYSCDSYLLNPIQRPGRYKLLLEKLEKELLKAGGKSKALSEVIRLINEKINEANTLMTIDSIQRCPINLRKMGSFIMKETFNIKKKYKSVIFLFAEIVVFTLEDPTRPDSYIYADSIEMTKLSISHNRSSTSFQLRNFDKSKLGEESKYTFDVEAPSMAIKEKWMEDIQNLLWGQLQYYKDQQKRTSLNKLAPAMFTVRGGSLREKRKSYMSPSKKRSTFYYDIK